MWKEVYDPPEHIFEKLCMTVNLHAHQYDALGKMHNGCILKGDVGTGKSITALAYFFIQECGGGLRHNGQGDHKPMANPKDLYIITTAKKRDDLEWEAECAPFALSTHPKGTGFGVKVTVDSWNNIPNYGDVKDAFFIFDEQRLIGAGAWVKAFLKIAKANHWIVLSATPGDTWMDYIPVFVANGYYKNRTEFIQRHVKFKTYTKFPQIDGYVDEKTLDKLRAKVIVDMPYARHTTRHVENVFVEHDEAKFERVVKDRWHVYEERPIRDVAELFAVMRKLVNSDPSRIGETMRLLEKHPRLIIFYNFNYELEALRILASTLSYPIGEWNGHKHQPVPEGDKWMYLVQYTAGAEGWNCIATDATLFYSLNYSYRTLEQAKGRIDRLNTPYNDLYYYILRSSAIIDTAINKAVATKKVFNESAFFQERLSRKQAA